MARNKKKKLTKQERTQKQFAREEQYRKAREEAKNAIETHQFNPGDIVRVKDKVGVIVSLDDNLLNGRWTTGERTFEKVAVDFYALANWWLKVQDKQEFPQDLREYLQEFIPTCHTVFQRWLEKKEFQASIDVPVACFCNADGNWTVRNQTVMFNKQKDQYLVFKGMFDAFSWLGSVLEEDETVTITAQSETRGWFETGSKNFEEATIQGIFGELLDQAYAVKEKRSRNLGLYKVFYSGQMLGQKGKQKVLVAPCNIRAL